jgi:hypothetical protein
LLWVGSLKNPEGLNAPLSLLLLFKGFAPDLIEEA